MTAAITAAAITAAGAAYSADRMNSAAGKTRKLGRRQLEEEQRQFDLTREDWAPWREAGQAALGRLEDPEAFQTSPAYNFIRGEGMRNIENQYSVRGSGGNAMKALADWNRQNASNEWWNWRSDQRAMAGLGTEGVRGSQVAGQNYLAGARGVRDNLASSAWQNAWQQSNAMNAGLGAINYGIQSYANRPPSGTTAPQTGYGGQRNLVPGTYQGYPWEPLPGPY